MRVNCGGTRPWEKCPKGWSQHVWSTDLTICYKDKTEVGDPVHGTLCGLYSYHGSPYSFELNIGCGSATNVLTDTCPSGYQRSTEPTNSNSFTRKNSVCVLINAQEHSSGTLCGMQVEDSINGPSCNGFNPGLRQCPPEYSLHRTAFNHFGFMVCVKN
jgi:hypothetical protein